MIRNKLPGDNFFVGLLAGITTLTLFYFGLRSVRHALAGHYGDPYFFPAPRIELITILLNIILFRVVIVNLEKEKTGKGILFITVILSVAFFFLFYKANFRLP
jgi:hypothetical protein